MKQFGWVRQGLLALAVIVAASQSYAMSVHERYLQQHASAPAHHTKHAAKKQAYKSHVRHARVAHAKTAHRAGHRQPMAKIHARPHRVVVRHHTARVHPRHAVRPHVVKTGHRHPLRAKHPVVRHAKVHHGKVRHVRHHRH